MRSGYTDVPHNISEIAAYVITEKEKIIAEIFSKSKCYFYDTCSFRRHANLRLEQAEYLLKYFKNQNGIVVITRCILMELASHSGRLNREYIEYIRCISSSGISIILMYEEDLFSVMEMCYSMNSVMNDYLCWAVRIIKNPVSTITKTLDENQTICNEVMKGKNLDNSRVYQRFFTKVRENKEEGDNLGEELLAICLYILSHLPGEENGKFCVITDDKGAAGKIDNMFRKTNKSHLGKEIGIFSTPKLVQVLYKEDILVNMEDMKDILACNTEGNIVVLGMLIHDVRNKEISASKEELVDLLMKPNGIYIAF